VSEPLAPWERKLWWILLALAFLLRVWSLGERPFHHDESIHAHAAFRLANEGYYRYDPVYHGPVQYFAVAISFFLHHGLQVLGSLVAGVPPPAQIWGSDLFARLPAALGGVALVALALFLRPRFGPAAALVSGLLLCTSPLLLYYTRFCREDVWSLLGTALAFLYLDRFVREGGVRNIALSALGAAVAFAAKENFYVLLALMIPSVAISWLEPGRWLDIWTRLRKLIDFLEKNGTALTGAFLLFFAVSELLYTVFLVHPDSGNPVLLAITYWWGQHKIERVGGRWYYHLVRLPQYEFAILIPVIFSFVIPPRLILTCLKAIPWLLSGPDLRRKMFRRRPPSWDDFLSGWKRLSTIERFLLGWGISSLAMYAYLGEKTPWLMVHQVLPFVPLAAKAWAEAFQRGTFWRWLGGLAGGATFVFALSLSFWLPALTPNVRKAESAIYVQTCPEFKGLAGEIMASAKAGAEPAAIVEGEAGWPMSWYVRQAPVNWQMPAPDRKAPIVITDLSVAEEAARILGPGYRREDVPFRAWWIPEDSSSLKPELHPNLSELMTYLFTRKVWQGKLPPGSNPIGALYVAVFRSGPGAPPAAPPPPPAPAPPPAGGLPRGASTPP